MQLVTSCATLCHSPFLSNTNTCHICWVHASPLSMFCDGSQRGGCRLVSAGMFVRHTEAQSGALELFSVMLWHSLCHDVFVAAALPVVQAGTSWVCLVYTWWLTYVLCQWLSCGWLQSNNHLSLGPSGVARLPEFGLTAMWQAIANCSRPNMTAWNLLTPLMHPPHTLLPPRTPHQAQTTGTVSSAWHTLHCLPLGCHNLGGTDLHRPTPLAPNHPDDARGQKNDTVVE